ncbi:MAG: Gfo/Idh/MocA family protein [Candidatus Hodarchaeota archaeon]
MLRVGIIGMGDIANLNVLGYLYSQDTEIVSVCDTDIKKAGEKLERWGLRITKIYEDYQKMIDREDLDIIEILTPNHLHAPMVEYAAKAGIRGISVQKPLANTISACEELIQVCKEEKIKLKLYENFRFYPIYLKAKELLDLGIIGKLTNFRINTINFGGPSMPIDLKSYIWRTNSDTCGGGPWMYDDGIHKFSMALWLMGQDRVEEVYSWIDYFTGAQDLPSYTFWKYPQQNVDEPPRFGSMQFINAPNVYYPSNYYPNDEFIEISGTKGMMWINQCTCGGNFLSKTPQHPPIIVFSNGEVKSFGEELPRDWRFSFINSTMHFIDVIKKSGMPIYNGEQGKNLCIFAKMPYISYQEKRIVNWREITSKNEEKGICLVKGPDNKDGRGLSLLYRRKKKDMRKGISQGLEKTNFKYQFD